MTTCGNRRTMRQSGDSRDAGGAQVGLRGLELRQFRWAKRIRSPFRVVLSLGRLSASRQISQRRRKIFFVAARSRGGSVLADAAEIDSERAQLAIEVRALHADTLRQLPDFTVTQQQLLLQIGALELLTRLAQRQGEQVLLH
jgi:hypothetical protein